MATNPFLPVPSNYEGPFTQWLTQPLPIQRHESSGWESGGVGAGNAALKFFAGAREGRIQNYLQREKEREQGLKALYSSAVRYASDPTIDQTLRDSIQDRYARHFKGEIDQATKGSKNPVVNLFRNIAIGATGGDMPKYKPVPVTEELGQWKMEVETNREERKNRGLALSQQILGRLAEYDELEARGDIKSPEEKTKDPVIAGAMAEILDRKLPVLPGINELYQAHLARYKSPEERLIRGTVNRDLWKEFGGEAATPAAATPQGPQPTAPAQDDFTAPAAQAPPAATPPPPVQVRSEDEYLQSAGISPFVTPVAQVTIPTTPPTALPAKAVSETALPPGVAAQPMSGSGHDSLAPYYVATPAGVPGYVSPYTLQALSKYTGGAGKAMVIEGPRKAWFHGYWHPIHKRFYDATGRLIPVDPSKFAPQVNIPSPSAPIQVIGKDQEGGPATLLVDPDSQRVLATYPRVSSATDVTPRNQMYNVGKDWAEANLRATRDSIADERDIDKQTIASLATASPANAQAIIAQGEKAKKDSASRLNTMRVEINKAFVNQLDNLSRDGKIEKGQDVAAPLLNPDGSEARPAVIYDAREANNPLNTVMGKTPRITAFHSYRTPEEGIIAGQAELAGEIQGLRPSSTIIQFAAKRSRGKRQVDYANDITDYLNKMVSPGITTDTKLLDLRNHLDQLSRAVMNAEGTLQWADPVAYERYIQRAEDQTINPPPPGKKGTKAASSATSPTVAPPAQPPGTMRIVGAPDASFTIPGRK